MIFQKLIDYTQEKVKRFFQRYPVPAHSFDHISRVAGFAQEIALGEKTDGSRAILAAWLHDIGRVPEHYRNPLHLPHQELSFQLASEWFKKDKRLRKLADKEKEEILYAIKNHNNNLTDDFFSVVILRDADKLDLFGPAGVQRHILWHDHDLPTIRFAMAFNLERASRIKTATARRILKEKKMLEPLRDFLAVPLPNSKVLCAISGGVDSAVAAAILQKAGYEVVGAFIKCYTDPVSGASCWINERRDALRVCAKLGIKLLDFDFEKEYHRHVLNYLFREYKAGRTPNPDVICNKYVKIPLLIKEAKRHGFDYVATGHYARLSHLKLLEAADKNKDQTYFLHQLKQSHLKKLLFPLGRLTKNEVRIFAKQWGLPVAEKEESMGICFVGEVPMNNFLKQKISPRKGKIVTTAGQVIGEHEGLPFYTIGQRIGGFNIQYSILNIQKGETQPFFVLKKDIVHNKLIVGHENDSLLYKKEINVANTHWIRQKPVFPLKCEVRLRHRQPMQECRITKSGARIKVDFKIPQRAVTPGQFAVFYSKGECLGGGEIV